ncbi:ABC transporter permease [Pseudonocardia kunmingensis]|uniref:NitT/TauT family transport system permease protein n=1 Tax=Pseudonocardia kunmingensis TaxID=630975 RepID=A0A543DQK2_9PSEU|nr:ABC transporter permease subunit [Pseudonocardia kunmingensis]TQM11593.1 NitT/TauT family transport system permease protein [Pseudonocardia kunmingensis]
MDPDGRTIMTKARRTNRALPADAKWTAILGIAVVGIVAFWQLAVTRLELVPAAFLPPPTAVAAAFTELVTRAEFWSALLFSLQNLAIGLVAAVVVGVVAGLAVGWFPVLHFTVAPFLWLLYSTPKVALAPLFILVLGLGNSSKIALVFLLAVFPILLNTMEGVETVSPSLVRAGRVFGFHGVALGAKIILPSTLPFSLAGIQRGAALGFTGAVLGEFLGGAGGLGHMLERAAFDFRMDEALAIVLVMVVIANGLLLAISGARRRWAPWYSGSVSAVS